MTKAIIEQVLNSYQVKVRIPIYHKLAGTAGATPSSDLPIAQVCVTNTMEDFYTQGDIVFIDFEDNMRSQPVVLGKLLTVTDEDLL